jgi:hypothetical protein
VLCPVYPDVDGEATVEMALKAISLLGEADLQARRYQTILESFNDVLQAEKAAKEATQAHQDVRSIFNVLFGNDNGQYSLDGSVGENPVAADIFQKSAMNGLEQIRVQEGLPSLNILSEAAAAMGRGSVAPWREQMTGIPDDNIDFDGLWWPNSQDNVFGDPGNMQVPLYGLMESA